MTTTTVLPLSRDDITAMRSADDISFHQYDGEAFIRAHLRGHGEQRIFTVREQKLFTTADHSSERLRHIPVQSSAFGYGYNTSGTGGWNSTNNPGYSAFAMTSTIGNVLRTILVLLKVDDILTLNWVADNNTEVIREANLHTDQLEIRVTRGDKFYVFLVKVQTGKDNSARMIKRDGL
jgi:hypothetical protein